MGLLEHMHFLNLQLAKKPGLLGPRQKIKFACDLFNLSMACEPNGETFNVEQTFEAVNDKWLRVFTRSPLWHTE
jgi:hypothetical protein